MVQPVATPTVPGRLMLDSLMAWLLGTRIYELLLCYSYSFSFFPFFFIISFPFPFFLPHLLFLLSPFFFPSFSFPSFIFFSIPFLSLNSFFLCPSFLSYFLFLIFFSFPFFLVHSFSFSFFPTFLFFYLFLILVLSGVSDWLNPMQKCHSCIFNSDAVKFYYPTRCFTSDQSRQVWVKPQVYLLSVCKDGLSCMDLKLKSSSSNRPNLYP